MPLYTLTPYKIGYMTLPKLYKTFKKMDKTFKNWMIIHFYLLRNFLSYTLSALFKSISIQGFYLSLQRAKESKDILFRRFSSIFNVSAVSFFFSFGILINLNGNQPWQAKKPKPGSKVLNQSSLKLLKRASAA